ncbi:MAG: small basic family protein [Fimbriimonadaceae bacterium]
MIFIPILAMFVGIVLGALISAQVPLAWAPYMSVAVLAGLDSICGGTRSYLEGKFQQDIFVSGFLFNILIAVFFVWLGVGIGLNLMLAAALVFGMRIFTNLSLIRRLALSRIAENRRKKETQDIANSGEMESANEA